MQSESQLNPGRSPQAQAGDKSGSWRMRNIVALIPSRTPGESTLASRLRPYIGAQLLGFDWMAPDFGGVVKNRRSKLLGQIMFYALGVESAGLYFSAMFLGNDIIPADTLPIILFLTAGISLFVIGIGLVSLLHRSTRRTRNAHPKPLLEK